MPLGSLLRTALRRELLFWWCWGSNSGPQECKIDTLPTELYLGGAFSCWMPSILVSHGELVYEDWEDVFRPPFLLVNCALVARSRPWNCLLAGF